MIEDLCVPPAHWSQISREFKTLINKLREACPTDEMADAQMPVLWWDFTEQRSEVQKAFDLSNVLSAA